jgi:hypothetical protein
MPWLEEDEIESNDPLEIERLTDNTDIIKEDVDRFYLASINNYCLILI